MDDYDAGPGQDLTPEQPGRDDPADEERYGMARRIALAHLGSERRPAAWFRRASADGNEPLFGLVADIMDAEAAARDARGRFRVLPGEGVPGHWQGT